MAAVWGLQRLLELLFHLIPSLLSTKSMRNDEGYEVIKKATEKLGLRHKEHIAAYGEGNERHLTGRHEIADIKTFSWEMRIKVKPIMSPHFVDLHWSNLRMQHMVLQLRI